MNAWQKNIAYINKHFIGAPICVGQNDQNPKHVRIFTDQNSTSIWKVKILFFTQSKHPGLDRRTNANPVRVRTPPFNITMQLLLPSAVSKYAGRPPSALPCKILSLILNPNFFKKTKFKKKFSTHKLRFNCRIRGNP